MGQTDSGGVPATTQRGVGYVEIFGLGPKVGPPGPYIPGIVSNVSRPAGNTTQSGLSRVKIAIVG